MDEQSVNLPIEKMSARIKSLEFELKILKAQLSHSDRSGPPLSSLRGILSGQSDVTYEEIKAAEYQLDDDLG